ncbi:MAG TPA: hybrid sensor histidine kinase/response regulator [Steroidobacteraceae bacterium]|nr:hybrid sensor histidine kinase/response regulator [Steroidobacteraceae bacterium]
MQAPVKCLVVDDIEENLTALAALLGQSDVEVFTARSGMEALELLLHHDFALALLDIQMPQMDGFQLAELMRGNERTRHVPLIFVTAGSRDQYRLFKGYEAGAVDFLYKPIEPHILKSKADIFFQLHRQKLQLTQELEERTQTLRLNEMFIAVLGHDLRNPLNAMLTSAHLLQESSPEDGTKDIAARIVSSGRRMTRMIEDLLDLARARLAGGIPLQREPVDLGTLVPRVLREHGATFPTKPIELDRVGDLTGSWDADRLAQVASNLVGNALQYGDDHHPVRVKLDGTADDLVVCSVVNAGSIPEEVLPSIFDPFRGGSMRTGRSDGLGLGLFIVRQIVQAHGGDVDVRTGDGNQTTFTVRIPRRAMAKLASPAAAAVPNV